jgi:hypothetical protein
LLTPGKRAARQNVFHFAGAMRKTQFVSLLCGCSSVDRALPCQGRGQEFESPHPHQFIPNAFRQYNFKHFMTGLNSTFRIITPITLGNLLKGTCIRVAPPLTIGSVLVTITFMLLGISFIVVLLVILSYCLLIPIVSLYKFYKSRRLKISNIEFVFTPTEFIIEVPNNSKVQISKSVIRRVKFYKKFVMLQTTSGKQPILVTPSQSIELKKFLQNNSYNT